MSLTNVLLLTVVLPPFRDPLLVVFVHVHAGLRKTGSKICIVRDNCLSLPLGLERLRLSNSHIISKIASANPFIFGHPALDNLMLAQDGVLRNEEKSHFSLTI